jgi:2-oxoglutarate ferredoxin oxidoreductase subunit beta
MHIIRRNLDVKILLFNNRIYGLTKGPVQPDERARQENQEHADGRARLPDPPDQHRPRRRSVFRRRAIDVDVKHLEYVLERAAKHTGTAVVEIYQNCNIFNDGAFQYATDKTTKSDTTVYLEHGKPLVFGKNPTKASDSRDAPGDRQPRECAEGRSARAR